MSWWPLAASLLSLPSLALPPSLALGRGTGDDGTGDDGTGDDGTGDDGTGDDEGEGESTGGGGFGGFNDNISGRMGNNTFTTGTTNNHQYTIPFTFGGQTHHMSVNFTPDTSTPVGAKLDMIRLWFRNFLILVMLWKAKLSIVLALRQW